MFGVLGAGDAVAAQLRAEVVGDEEQHIERLALTPGAAGSCAGSDADLGDDRQRAREESAHGRVEGCWQHVDCGI